MTSFQHAIRIGLLMAVTAGLMSWGLRHTEASFADGLRYIRQAEQIDRGDWQNGLVGSIDHPLHPLGIVAAHGLVGGEGPVSWQQAAVALAFGCIVLLVIPLYLLTRDAFGDETAWLGCLLVTANPLFSSILANVLSESSFLLFWTWGLWAAIRFLREGRFFWLPLTISFGVLAYLSRPEGLLLPMAMVLTLSILPLHRATRINWPRWGAAVAFLLLGSLVLAGPYMALKGGVGTKPAIARVLGLAPGSHPQALERERPLPPAQTTLQTYCLATERMVKVVRGVVSTPLVPLALLGLVVMPPGHARTDLVVLRGRAAGVGDRTRQAARDRRILHGAPRSGSGTHLDPCRGAWPGLADGQDLDSRRVAGSGRAATPAGSGGLGGLACGSNRRAPAARLGAVDTGTFPCLS